MSDIKIIAQVGDTRRLDVADFGKRRFLRLGASEKNPNLVQGTLHTGAILGADADTATALGLLGLTIFENEHALKYDAFVHYYLTGAIAYSYTVSAEDVAAAMLRRIKETAKKVIAELEAKANLSEEEQALLDRFHRTAADPESLIGDVKDEECIGILASVREAPNEDNDYWDIRAFERQYPGTGSKTFRDRSVARKLDEALAEHARQSEVVSGDGTYLAAWALTHDEALDPESPSGEVYISRELADPDLGGSTEPNVDQFDGDVGPAKRSFNQEAADVLLESNGYRRVGQWVEGSMDGRRQSNPAALTEGRSCTVIRMSENV